MSSVEGAPSLFSMLSSSLHAVKPNVIIPAVTMLMSTCFTITLFYFIIVIFKLLLNECFFFSESSELSFDNARTVQTECRELALC